MVLINIIRTCFFLQLSPKAAAKSEGNCPNHLPRSLLGLRCSCLCLITMGCRLHLSNEITSSVLRDDVSICVVHPQNILLCPFVAIKVPGHSVNFGNSSLSGFLHTFQNAFSLRDFSSFLQMYFLWEVEKQTQGVTASSVLQATPIFY